MARSQARWAALLWLMSVAGSVVAFESDFSFYPPASQSCLNKASKQSNCEGKDKNSLNSCLCSNGGDFVINTAKCLGGEENVDVVKVWTTMSTACDESNTPLDISQREFVAAAEDETKTSTTTTATTTTKTRTTSTSTSTATKTNEPTETASNDNEDSGGLSQSAMIGIGAGAGVAGLLAVAGLIFFLIRRRRNFRDDVPPPDFKSDIATTFPASEPSPADFGHETKPWPSPASPNAAAVAASSMQSPQSSAWGSPPMPQGQRQRPIWQQAYPGHSGYAAYVPPRGFSGPIPQVVVSGVAEMDGTGSTSAPRQSAPVEMLGSTPPSVR